MNNTSSWQQKSQTVYLHSTLMIRQYQLDLMARFMEVKSINPNLEKSEIANELGCSSIYLQRYRQDINMFSLYRIPRNSHKKQIVSNREHDLERPQMTSNDLK